MLWFSNLLKGFATYDLVLILVAFVTISLCILGISIY
jgi:hypothetical protein